MNRPKISVIIVYNNNSNIENCIKSIKEQSFSNIEIICINNGAKDKLLEIMQEFAQNDDRIKLINLSAENDIEYAKRVGLGITSTDYVCFLDGNTVIEKDYIQSLYLELTTKENTKIENGHLYKRNYLESCDEVLAVLNQQIEEKIKAELERQAVILKEEKEKLKEEWDKFYKINSENINNSTYELNCRFSQLEKNVYDRDCKFDEKMDGALKWHSEQFDDKIHKIYEDISKIYDFVKAEINQKGTEINNVYEAISKNYEYTEKIIDNKTNDIAEKINNIEAPVMEKISEFEKELTLRYVNLKRLMDVQLDEFKVQLSAVTGNSKDIEAVIGKTMNESIDGLYENINKLSVSFYDEISKLYSDMNTRINQDKEDIRYRNEQQISALRQEIESRFNTLNKE